MGKCLKACTTHLKFYFCAAMDIMASWVWIFNKLQPAYSKCIVTTNIYNAKYICDNGIHRLKMFLKL